jgi:Leucine-rich repeat (LRR) protein
MYVSQNQIREFDPRRYPALEVLHIAGNPIAALPAMSLRELVHGRSQDASLVDCPAKRQHVSL